MSLAKSATTGHWHWFSYDRDGWWSNAQRDGTLFSPGLFTASLKPLTAQVADLWCYQTKLAPGNVVVDIGAGIGDHVFVFSRLVGPAGRVVAIEAHPAAVRCLSLTVARNHLDNTSVIEEAAWDRETTLLMSDDEMHERNAVDGAVGTIRVRARTVDDMLEPLNLTKIDLVKMNIEGAEATALAGMQATLVRSQAVVISCHDFLATEAADPRRTKAAVIAILERAGFSVVTRPDAHHSFMRDYVYARRRS